MRELIRCVLPALLLLASIQVPPDNYLPPIIQRLDPTFHGFDHKGRDLFVTIENQRYLFWLNTGELPVTLLDITNTISRRLALLKRRGGRRQRIRGYNSVNKVLMTLMWLRKYPCIDTFALMFDASPLTVSAMIQSVVPVL